MYERDDGLLEGSRSERVQEVISLQSGGWDLDTLVGIMQGLLDHAEEVRLASVETLMGIAKQNPKPMSLTPVSLMEHFMFSFTASSHASPRTFEFLVENSNKLGTTEAVKRALLDVGRNEDFETFINIIIKSGKTEFLEVFEDKKLSKTKAQILKKALGSIHKNA